MYHHFYGAFPPGVTTDANGQLMHSWKAYLLRFLDEPSQYAYDFNEPWNGPNNRVLLDRCPDVFRCPSDPENRSSSSYQIVVGKESAWRINESVRLSQIVDGASNTIAVVEVRSSKNWLDPTPLEYDDLPLPMNAEGLDPCLGSKHGRGLQALFFDGSPRFISEGISLDHLYRILAPDDGEPMVDPEDYTP